MTSPPLQGKHHHRQIFRFYFSAFGIVTDIIVLTEGAQEITGSEKDSAGTGISHKRGLFPEVGMQACDFGLFTRAAKAEFPGQSINMAFPWAQSTIVHQLHRPIDTILQFSLPVQFQIGWFVHQFAYPLFM
jgi:hypothetical protein